MGRALLMIASYDHPCFLLGSSRPPMRVGRVVNTGGAILASPRPVCGFGPVASERGL